VAICIDRCVCFGVPFARLKREAEATRARTVAQLQERIMFGQKCRMCHPYVRAMLATGETTFDRVLLPGDVPEPDGAGR
jgi:bacterioferritin-associated ferredoxin